MIKNYFATISLFLYFIVMWLTTFFIIIERKLTADDNARWVTNIKILLSTMLGN